MYCEAIYAFYKKQSKFGAQIAFMVDQQPFSPRRSAAMNNFDVVCKRSLTKDEIEEVKANAEVWNRRFRVWYYKDIDYLIFEDRKYGVETPNNFIKECKKRGFIKKQLEIEFEL